LIRRFSTSNSSEEDKRTGRILYGIFAICGLPLAALVAWYISKEPHRTMREKVLYDAPKMSFHARIDSKYHQTQNHNTPTVRLCDEYIYELWQSWYDKVDVGDSLVKKKGELQVIVFKHNGMIVILDYKELVKGFKE